GPGAPSMALPVVPPAVPWHQPAERKLSFGGGPSQPHVIARRDGMRPDADRKFSRALYDLGFRSAWQDVKTLHDQSQFSAWRGSVLAAMEMADLPIWTKLTLIKTKLPLDSPQRRSLEQMLKGVTKDSAPPVEIILDSLGKATPRSRRGGRPML